MNWETLLCWGDSITIGSRSYLCYPEYAAQSLATSTDRQWHAITHAVCGYTTCDLNRSLAPELGKMKDLAPGLLTIMIGTNDLKSPTAIEPFRIAYSQLLIKARLVCSPNQILLFEIPELRTGVMYPYLVSMNATVKKYNAVIREMADQFGVRTMQADLEDRHLFDGVHLNETGSEHVGSQLAAKVLEDRGLTLPQKKEANSISIATASSPTIDISIPTIPLR